MEGIVLQAIEYKEKSKLVYLYTPFGIQSVKALDAAKKKLGFVTTFNVVDFETTKAKLPTVVDYIVKKSYYSYYEHLEKLSITVPMIDVLKHLDIDAPHHRIYPFFLECLTLLNDKEPEYILSLFLVKMLSVFGVKPGLTACVRCGRLSIVDFSISDGGALCDQCSSKNLVHMRLYQSFYLLYNHKNYEEVPHLELSYSDILEAIYAYYLIHVNLKLKSYHL